MRSLFALLTCLLLSVPSSAAVRTGLDRLEAEGFKTLQGKRVGLITNHTGRDSAGRSTAEALAKAPGVKLMALFTPEHGFLGTAPAGAAIGPSTDPVTGLPVHSLYGRMKRPTPEMLAGLDVLVFDIQDVGARFYTYLTTMGYALEAAAEAGIEFVVLDRPNPVGGAMVEGPVKVSQVSAFTSYFPVPIRHGLTAGEMARMHNDSLETPARLTVVPMEGWTRGMLWPDTGLEWVNPSPNIRNPDAALLYPGIGCFEATNLSVGRGTDTPFEWVGAPWLNDKVLFSQLKELKIPGFKFKRQVRTPTDDLYKGVETKGIQIKVTDPSKARPLDLFVHLMALLRDEHSYEFEPRWDEIRLMVGNEDFEKRYLSHDSPWEILEAFHKDEDAFNASRKPFLLYP